MAPARLLRPRAQLPQQERLVAAIAYFGALLLLGRYLNGAFWPPYGIDGLWFYSAAAALLLGEFILEPFFTTPADAIGNGLAVLLAAATASLQGADVSHEAATTGRLIVMLAAGVLIAVAVLAIAFKDAGGARGRLAAASTALASRLGRARWVFTALLFLSGYAAFANSTGKVAALYLTWFAVLVLAPVEFGLTLRRRRKDEKPLAGGVVEALDDPGIILIRLPAGTEVSLGDEVTVADSTTHGTVVEVTRLTQEPLVRVAVDDPAPVRIGARVEIQPARERGTSTIGHVFEGTTIDELRVATIPLAAELGVEEGRMIEADIGGQPTLYQVVAGEIVPRSDGELRRHLVRVSARKLGRWNEDETIFDPVGWVPSPGRPVSLVAMRVDDQTSEEAVGHVPGTSYGIRVKPHDLVTHNTAILGILGIGKTHLAWELIHRMLAEGIKVVALDISGRYSEHFADLCPRATEDAIAEEIESRISANVANRAVRDDEAGNLHDFLGALGDVLERFVESDDRLLILNPNRFEVTRMEGKPYNEQANFMVALTMVDVTRIVAEKLLTLLQAKPRDVRDETAALCLVLEEAHALVPEWTSTATESERQATNGAVRAVLQGRKYGFGCLVITQRTANVTKSILNQCNTVFAMRVYDATGMGFVENYIGPAYAQLLSALKERQAVVFGRASSCNSPVIVELNDTDRFEAQFWIPRAAAIPATQLPDGEAQDQPPPEEADPEDIPF
jgi:uncharacterized protein